MRPADVETLVIAAGHDCQTVRDAGWEGLTNGELLAQAELLFEVLITVDKNLHYQQNFRIRAISILLLRANSNDLDDLKPLVPSALNALKSIQPGQVLEIKH